MGNITVGAGVNRKIKKATFEAVIIRADGARENLGVIAHTSSNPFARVYWAIKLYLKGKFRK